MNTHQNKHLLKTELESTDAKLKISYVLLQKPMTLNID